MRCKWHKNIYCVQPHPELNIASNVGQCVDKPRRCHEKKDITLKCPCSSPLTLAADHRLAPCTAPPPMVILAGPQAQRDPDPIGPAQFLSTGRMIITRKNNHTTEIRRNRFQTQIFELSDTFSASDLHQSSTVDWKRPKSPDMSLLGLPAPWPTQCQYHGTCPRVSPDEALFGGENSERFWLTLGIFR